MVRKYSCYDNEEEMNRKNCILLKKKSINNFFFHFIRRFVICKIALHILLCSIKFISVFIITFLYFACFCWSGQKTNPPLKKKENKTSTSCEIQLLNTKVQWQEGDFHTCRKQSISIHSSPTENMKLYDDSKE